MYVGTIPLLLLIGWRGSPKGPPDEPQHQVKGKITKDILKLLDIKTVVLNDENEETFISSVDDTPQGIEGIDY